MAAIFVCLILAAMFLIVNDNLVCVDEIQKLVDDANDHEAVV